jgi:hypothetical protein
MENEANVAQNVPDVDENALSELKRRLGELSKEDVVLTDQQILNFNVPVGATTYTDGSVTYRSLLIPRKFCQGSTLLDASGQVVTAANGQVTFLLSSILCTLVNSFTAPVNLEATPFARTPVYVTSQYTLVPNPSAPGTFNDLKITLMAWTSNGTPAPEVVIDWRCRLVSVQIIL